MTLTIGIEYRPTCWKICLVDDDQLLEYHEFGDDLSAQAYVVQTCAYYPEPIITIASTLDIAFLPVNQLDEHKGLDASIRAFFELVSLKCYFLPALARLTCIPAYRCVLRHGNMGNSHTLGAIATLLYRMRLLDASWTDMRFFYLEIEPTAYSVTVIVDGIVVDGLSIELPLLAKPAESVIEEAFWESLTQTLAGLLAIHQLEDVVVRERCPAFMTSRSKEAVIERLGSFYQFYHFPLSETEPEGFEIALGAALLAGSFFRHGLAAEVSQRLLFDLAQS